MKTRVLIDGDIVMVSSCFASQEVNPFDRDGAKTFNGNLARTIIRNQIQKISNRLSADETCVYMSCSREDNWRRDVSPTYKANRDNTAPPVGLEECRTFLYENWDIIQEPRLEADDLLSMEYFTKERGVRKIIATKDKDLLSLGPGETYSMQKDKLLRVSAKTCTQFFIYQCLQGDSVDGIPGIKGVGKVKATKFVKSLKTLSDAWSQMVELAEKQGQNEEHLLTQARQVYLLRPGDYDKATGSIRYFEPGDINKML